MYMDAGSQWENSHICMDRRYKYLNYSLLFNLKLSRCVVQVEYLSNCNATNYMIFNKYVTLFANVIELYEINLTYALVLACIDGDCNFIVLEYS